MSPSLALALVATLAAVSLLVPPRAARPWRGRTPPSARTLTLVGVGATTSAVVVVPQQAALLVIAASAGAVGWRLVRARARRRLAERTSRQVLEACEGLAADLVAGQPPGVVLDRGAQEWPLLAPVAEAFRVGADVPAAWRGAAHAPGAGDLRLVAAAWHLSHRTGAGLAATLDQVVADLRATRATRRIVEGELASARATAKLVAMLPVLALSMGSGAGGDPWGFLLTTSLGLACLAAGLAFAAVGLAWIEALARAVDRT